MTSSLWTLISRCPRATRRDRLPGTAAKAPPQGSSACALVPGGALRSSGARLAALGAPARQRLSQHTPSSRLGGRRAALFALALLFAPPFVSDVAASPPSLQSADVYGDELHLTFDQTMATSGRVQNGPTSYQLSDMLPNWSVNVDGVRRSLSNPRVDDRVLKLDMNVALSADCSAHEIGVNYVHTRSGRVYSSSGTYLRLTGIGAVNRTTPTTATGGETQLDCPTTGGTNVVSASVSEDGAYLAITFDNVLDPNSVNPPRSPASKHDFTVTAAGDTVPVLWAKVVESLYTRIQRDGVPITQSEPTETLNLTLPVGSIRKGQTVSVSYRQRTTGRRIRSTGGIYVASFTNRGVTNRSTLEPLSSTGLEPVLWNAFIPPSGTTLHLTFDRALQNTETPPSAFSIESIDPATNASSTIGVLSVSIVNPFPFVTLKLAETIEYDRTVRVSYVDPGDATALQGSGSDAGVDSFEDVEATSTSRVGAPPLPSLSVANVVVMELTAEPNLEDPSTLASTEMFTVTLDSPQESTVTVRYYTEDGTARRCGSTSWSDCRRKATTLAVDYILDRGELVFAPGETSKALEWTVLNDQHDEELEYFTLHLYQVMRNTQFGQHRATGTITNTEVGLPGAPRVTAVTLAPDSSGDRAWTAGESIEVRLTFNEAVTVDSFGTPSVLITVGGLPGVLHYASGSGTDTLTFSVEVSSGALSDIAVTENSLATNGSILVSEASGLPAVLDHPGTVATGGEATRVVSAAVTSTPGDNGTWDAGETVEAQVEFSRAVRFAGVPGSSPTLAIVLDGTRREASYAGGGGTDTLRFEHTVTAADDGARKARVATNGLDPNGTTLADTFGYAAELGFDVAPWVTAVAVEPDASGDRRWTSGETVEARLTFSEAVRVAIDQFMPSIGLRLGGHPGLLGYTSGSGSDTLVFSTTVPEDNAALSQIAVVADSLARNGATIVSQASGLAAELGHEGTDATEAPAQGTASNALDARFLEVPFSHGGAAFTFELDFQEEVSLSYVTLRDAAFTVVNGEIESASRVTAGSNEVWKITIDPDGTGDVTVTLPASTDCSAPGAFCTAGNRSNRVRALGDGPAHGVDYDAVPGAARGPGRA